MDIQQKRIVVTGAASGIGRALLQQLAGYPAQIVAADRDGAGLQGAIAAVGRPGAHIVSFVGDLSHSEQVDGLFQFAVERMGGIDLFIANAGFGYCERLERADWQHIDAIYRTNVFSPIYAIEKMAELPHESPYRVVITGSVLGRIALEGYALYTSTKAALDRFLEGYRLELGGAWRFDPCLPPRRPDQFLRCCWRRPHPMAHPVRRTGRPGDHPWHRNGPGYDLHLLDATGHAVR